MRDTHIFLLVGPKGSGKSFIGSLLDREFGVSFIRVEDWVRTIRRDRNIDDETYVREAFEVIEQGVRQQAGRTDELVFESTGLTTHFDNMLESLRRDFRVTTIGITASPATCLERVRSRDRAIHINVSDDQLVSINDRVRARDLPTDFRIHNDGREEEDLIRALAAILGRPGRSGA